MKISLPNTRKNEFRVVTPETDAEAALLSTMFAGTRAKKGRTLLVTISQAKKLAPQIQA